MLAQSSKWHQILRTGLYGGHLPRFRAAVQSHGQIPGPRSALARCIIATDLLRLKRLAAARHPGLLELILRTYLGPAEAARIARADTPERQPALA